MELIEVGGRKIAYHRAGAGHPLVLLHGAWSDGREWRPQLAGLSDEFDVIAWDAPGLRRVGRPARRDGHGRLRRRRGGPGHRPRSRAGACVRAVLRRRPGAGGVPAAPRTGPVVGAGLGLCRLARIVAARGSRGAPRPSARRARPPASGVDRQLPARVLRPTGAAGDPRPRPLDHAAGSAGRNPADAGRVRRRRPAPGASRPSPCPPCCSTVQPTCARRARSPKRCTPASRTPSSCCCPRWATCATSRRPRHSTPRCGGSSEACPEAQTMHEGPALRLMRLPGPVATSRLRRPTARRRCGPTCCSTCSSGGGIGLRPHARFVMFIVSCGRITLHGLKE